jgi:hypothetical protein
MKSITEKIAVKSYEDIFSPTNPEGQQANGGVTFAKDLKFTDRLLVCLRLCENIFDSNNYNKMV